MFPPLFKTKFPFLKEEVLNKVPKKVSNLFFFANKFFPENPFNFLYFSNLEIEFFIKFLSMVISSSKKYKISPFDFPIPKFLAFVKLFLFKKKLLILIFFQILF